MEAFRARRFSLPGRVRHATCSDTPTLQGCRVEVHNAQACRVILHAKMVCGISLGILIPVYVYCYPSLAVNHSSVFHVHRQRGPHKLTGSSFIEATESGLSVLLGFRLARTSNEVNRCSLSATEIHVSSLASRAASALPGSRPSEMRGVS